MIVTEATIDIGFDGKKADDGIKQTRKNVKDLHDDAKKAGKELNNSLKDLRDLGREIATNPAFLGGMAIIAVSSELNKTARAIRETSYLAQNIALPENKIRAFGRVAEQSGASIESMNGFLQSMAQKSALLNTGRVSVSSAMGAAFTQYGGNAEIMRRGSPEQQLLHFAEIYKTIEKRALSLGKTKEQAQSLASQEMMVLGVNQDLIPVLRMQGDELKSQIESQSKLFDLTEANKEEAQRFARGWTVAAQTLELSVEQAKLLAIKGTVDTIELFVSPITKAQQAYENYYDFVYVKKPITKALKPELDFFLKATSNQNVVNFWKNQLNPIKDIENGTNRAKNALIEYSNTNLDNLLAKAEKLKNTFSGMNLNPLQSTGENLGGAIYNATHSDAVEPVYKMTSAKQKQNMGMVYQAYRNQGLSKNQAATMTSEVGRENDFNDRFMFGTHTDKAGGQNIGMISMQGDRNTKLRAYLTRMGLMKNGVMEQSQRAIDAQAAFQVAEMKSGSYPKAEKFLANPNIGRDEGSELIGTGYVKWAKHQTRLRNGESFDPRPHLAKEYGYYDRVHAFTPNQMAAQQAQSQHIANTNNTTNNNLSQQPFSVTNSFNINATDPKGTAKEVSEIFNKQKMTWAQTGQQ